MHFQIAPCEEVKIVRCTRGAIFDVIVDCRIGSPTLGQWQGFVLNEDNHDALYIPKGFAHGFQTLEDSAEVFYQMSEFHQPELARGFSHLDARIGIQWPEQTANISIKDSELESFEDCLML